MQIQVYNTHLPFSSKTKTEKKTVTEIEKRQKKMQKAIGTKSETETEKETETGKEKESREAKTQKGRGRATERQIDREDLVIKADDAQKIDTSDQGQSATSRKQRQICHNIWLVDGIVHLSLHTICCNQYGFFECCRDNFKPKMVEFIISFWLLYKCTICEDYVHFRNFQTSWRRHGILERSLHVDSMLLGNQPFFNFNLLRSSFIFGFFFLRSPRSKWTTDNNFKCRDITSRFRRRPTNTLHQVYPVAELNKAVILSTPRKLVNAGCGINGKVHIRR